MAEKTEKTEKPAAEKPQRKTDGNAGFLRAARDGNLNEVLEYLKGSTDINTSNPNGLNALHLASKEGHLTIVQELLRRGANVEAATKKGNTALHIASLAGHEKIVKILVESGAHVNLQAQAGFTPLYMAAQEGHSDVVKYLLSNGGNQSLATEDGFTPLAVALQQGHDRVVSVLLEHDTKGKVRLPALHIAAKKDDVKSAALLLQNEQNNVDTQTKSGGLVNDTTKSGFTPLHIASHYGNTNVCNLLIQRGGDVNFKAKNNITPLHVASRWGKSNMVQLLLDNKAIIEERTRDGLTPLHCAARSGHEGVVDLLLEREAPHSSKTKNGLTSLHMAAQGDHVDCARLLLYHKANVDEVTVDYLTPLHVAAHCGNVKTAKLLLDRKCEPNSRALNGFTPLHIACKKNRIKVVELLLKYGASIEATTESGLTPLHVASFMGHMNIVIYLIQHNANPDTPTVRGETSLHLAARANQTDIIRILLRNGATVDAKAREQQTPLHIASRLGNVDNVVLLLQHGASADATTKDKYTPLHIAAKEGHDEVAQVLLENGASHDMTTKKGFTPLHIAAKYGNIKVARLLLQKDANPDIQGKNGLTPLHVATHYNHVNVAQLLLENKASPHASAKNGYTPLHIAAKKNQMDIATALLEYGAKPNAESKNGFTPLHLASQEGHTDVVSLLLEKEANVNARAHNGLTPMHLAAQEDKVPVAEILVKYESEIDSHTKAGYTPLHTACHFGQVNMVRFLLAKDASVSATTKVGYTPLHQAAQQGHVQVVNLLLKNQASPNAVTNNGQTPLAIAQKLGYISVVEMLKPITEVQATLPVSEDKYKVVSPETMQETFISDSEDEGVDDFLPHSPLFGKPVSEQHVYLPYYEAQKMHMHGREDSMSLERGGSASPLDTSFDKDYMEAQHMSQSFTQSYSAVALGQAPGAGNQRFSSYSGSSFSTTFDPDNIPVDRSPVYSGKLKWKSFLISFMVDARGGAMRGCRHSGVRVVIPPKKCSMPTRVTCRLIKKEKLMKPPPMSEGEGLAARILEMGPVGTQFLGPIIMEIPHYAALRGKEREVVVMRSDNGESWYEHPLAATEEAVSQALGGSLEDLEPEESLQERRITRILTTDFPQYFALVTRVKQETAVIGFEGGVLSSTVVPQVQAVLPEGTLTKPIKVGLQAQPVAPELVAKLLGNRVAVSPIVTVEPRRRKFHKPITLTIPVPKAAQKGMINQYGGADRPTSYGGADRPTLRLLYSLAGNYYSNRADPAPTNWEDITDNKPITLVNDCVSFTTTVSARFWLIDCQNVQEATRMASALYHEAISVPYMAKFVVFGKRTSTEEGRLRMFCMTDDRVDKTLEKQEKFVEIARSRDIEVLDGRPQYVEMAGNLIPMTKSGDQLHVQFKAFRENRLPSVVKVRDPDQEAAARVAFMKEPKLARGEAPQTPVCNLNIRLPDTISSSSSDVSSDTAVEIQKRHSLLREQGIVLEDHVTRSSMNLSDVADNVQGDWVMLAQQLGVSMSDINRIKTEYPTLADQALAMLQLWVEQNGDKATGNVLENALQRINREDVVKKCMYNTEVVNDQVEAAAVRATMDQSGFDTFKEEVGISKDSMKRGMSLDVQYDEQDMIKESESAEESSPGSDRGTSVDRGSAPQAIAEVSTTMPEDTFSSEVDQRRPVAVSPQLSPQESEENAQRKKDAFISLAQEMDRLAELKEQESKMQRGESEERDSVREDDIVRTAKEEESSAPPGQDDGAPAEELIRTPPPSPTEKFVTATTAEPAEESEEEEVVQVDEFTEIVETFRSSDDGGKTWNTYKKIIRITPEGTTENVELIEDSSAPGSTFAAEAASRLSSQPDSQVKAQQGSDVDGKAAAAPVSSGLSLSSPISDTGLSPMSEGSYKEGPASVPEPTLPEDFYEEEEQYQEFGLKGDLGNEGFIDRREETIAVVPEKLSPEEVPERVEDFKVCLNDYSPAGSRRRFSPGMDMDQEVAHDSSEQEDEEKDKQQEKATERIATESKQPQAPFPICTDFAELDPLQSSPSNVPEIKPSSFVEQQMFPDTEGRNEVTVESVSQTRSAFGDGYHKTEIEITERKTVITDKLIRTEESVISGPFPQDTDKMRTEQDDHADTEYPNNDLFPSFDECREELQTVDEQEEQDMAGTGFVQRAASRTENQGICQHDEGENDVQEFEEWELLEKTDLTEEEKTAAMDENLMHVASLQEQQNDDETQQDMSCQEMHEPVINELALGVKNECGQTETKKECDELQEETDFVPEIDHKMYEQHGEQETMSQSEDENSPEPNIMHAQESTQEEICQEEIVETIRYDDYLNEPSSYGLKEGQLKEMLLTGAPENSQEIYSDEEADEQKWTPAHDDEIQKECMENEQDTHISPVQETETSANTTEALQEEACLSGGERLMTEKCTEEVFHKQETCTQQEHLNEVYQAAVEWGDENMEEQQADFGADLQIASTPSAEAGMIPNLDSGLDKEAFDKHTSDKFGFPMKAEYAEMFEEKSSLGAQYISGYEYHQQESHTDVIEPQAKQALGAHGTEDADHMNTNPLMSLSTESTEAEVASSGEGMFAEKVSQEYADATTEEEHKFDIHAAELSFIVEEESKPLEMVAIDSPKQQDMVDCDQTEKTLLEAQESRMLTTFPEFSDEQEGSAPPEEHMQEEVCQSSPFEQVDQEGGARFTASAQEEIPEEEMEIEQVVTCDILADIHAMEQRTAQEEAEEELHDDLDQYEEEAYEKEADEETFTNVYVDKSETFWEEDVENPALTEEDKDRSEEFYAERAESFLEPTIETTGKDEQGIDQGEEISTEMYVDRAEHFLERPVETVTESRDPKTSNQVNLANGTSTVNDLIEQAIEDKCKVQENTEMISEDLTDRPMSPSEYTLITSHIEEEPGNQLLKEDMGGDYLEKDKDAESGEEKTDEDKEGKIDKGNFLVDGQSSEQPPSPTEYTLISSQEQEALSEVLGLQTGCPPTAEDRNGQESGEEALIQFTDSTDNNATSTINSNSNLVKESEQEDELEPTASVMPPSENIVRSSSYENVYQNLPLTPENPLLPASAEDIGDRFDTRHTEPHLKAVGRTSSFEELYSEDNILEANAFIQEGGEVLGAEAAPEASYRIAREDDRQSSASSDAARLDDVDDGDAEVLEWEEAKSKGTKADKRFSPLFKGSPSSSVASQASTSAHKLSETRHSAESSRKEQKDPFYYEPTGDIVLCYEEPTEDIFIEVEENKQKSQETYILSSEKTQEIVQDASFGLTITDAHDPETVFSAEQNNKEETSSKIENGVPFEGLANAEMRFNPQETNVSGYVTSALEETTYEPPGSDRDVDQEKLIPPCDDSSIDRSDDDSSPVKFLQEKRVTFLTNKLSTPRSSEQSSDEYKMSTSSSEISVEPTLLAASYDLDSGQVTHVVSALDISPDAVENKQTPNAPAKSVLSSPEDDVFEAGPAFRFSPSMIDTHADDITHEGFTTAPLSPDIALESAKSEQSPSESFLYEKDQPDIPSEMKLVGDMKASSELTVREIEIQPFQEDIFQELKEKDAEDVSEKIDHQDSSHLKGATSDFKMSNKVPVDSGAKSENRPGSEDTPGREAQHITQNEKMFVLTTGIGDEETAMEGSGNLSEECGTQDDFLLLMKQVSSDSVKNIQHSETDIKAEVHYSPEPDTDFHEAEKENETIEKVDHTVGHIHSAIEDVELSLPLDSRSCSFPFRLQDRTESDSDYINAEMFDSAEFVSPDDHGDSSGADSFATVMAAEADDGDEDMKDKMAEIASMSSSIHSDILLTQSDLDEHFEEIEYEASMLTLQDSTSQIELVKEPDSPLSTEGNGYDSKDNELSSSGESAGKDCETSSNESDRYESYLDLSSSIEFLDRATALSVITELSEEEQFEMTDPGNDTGPDSDQLDQFHCSPPDGSSFSPAFGNMKHFAKYLNDRDETSASPALQEFERLEKQIGSSGSSSVDTSDKESFCGSFDERKHFHFTVSSCEEKKFESGSFDEKKLLHYRREMERDDASTTSSLAEFEKLECQIDQQSSTSSVEDKSAQDSKGYEKRSGSGSGSVAGSASSLADCEKLESEMGPEVGDNHSSLEYSRQQQSERSSLASLNEFDKQDIDAVVNNERRKTSVDHEGVVDKESNSEEENKDMDSDSLEGDTSEKTDMTSSVIFAGADPSVVHKEEFQGMDAESAATGIMQISGDSLSLSQQIPSSDSSKVDAEISKDQEDSMIRSLDSLEQDKPSDKFDPDSLQEDVMQTSADSLDIMQVEEQTQENLMLSVESAHWSMGSSGGIMSRSDESHTDSHDFMQVSAESMDESSHAEKQLTHKHSEIIQEQSAALQFCISSVSNVQEIKPDATNPFISEDSTLIKPGGCHEEKYGKDEKESPFCYRGPCKEKKEDLAEWEAKRKRQPEAEEQASFNPPRPSQDNPGVSGPEDRSIRTDEDESGDDNPDIAGTPGDEDDAFTHRVVMKKEVHQKTTVRVDGQEDTVITEDSQVHQDADPPEVLRQSMEQIIQQFMHEPAQVQGFEDQEDPDHGTEV